MLFDLRGRGRRRTVRVVYSGLALLFLLGFVGFGVGSFGGGGVAELLGGGKGGSGSGEDFGAQVKAAKKVTVSQPNNPAAWSGLVYSTLRLAASGENYNRSETEEGFTAKAQPVLHEAQEAWVHYLKLVPRHPNSERASEVMRIYTTPGGLTNPALAVRTLKAEIAGRAPNVTLYYDLAVLSYQAKDKREGDRAAAKALALAPASDKKILESRLAEIKSGKSATSTGTTGGASTGTTGSSSGSGGAQTITIPASKLGKGATKAQTVTIPASSLPKGTGTGTTGATITGLTTSTAPTPAAPAPKK